jgi:hydrogenase expression/formation protein HypD
MHFEFDQSKFRDSALARALIRSIRTMVCELETEFHGELGSADNPIRLMEVCGTHTVSIFRSGLSSIFDSIEGFDLISGPGCPVCVTSTSDIDAALEVALKPDVIFTTFGDMVKVPGSHTNLSLLKTQGAHVRIVNSPIELVELASKNPDGQVVFFSVGFETTTPGIAYTLKKAKALSIKNLSIVTVNKTVPPALNALCSMGDFQLHGFILPGHVSTIIGIDAYKEVTEMYRIPAVVTGFEPLEILHGIFMLLKQIRDKRFQVESAYTYAVPEKGNTHALTVMAQVFQPADAIWRGLGLIPKSGLELNRQYEDFDALKRFGVEKLDSIDNPACRCGEVLVGKSRPTECPLFGKACTPETPVGACMVSSEGTCSAYFKYGKGDSNNDG